MFWNKIRHVLIELNLLSMPLANCELKNKLHYAQKNSVGEKSISVVKWNNRKQTTKLTVMNINYQVKTRNHWHSTLRSQLNCLNVYVIIENSSTIHSVKAQYHNIVRYIETKIYHIIPITDFFNKCFVSDARTPHVCVNQYWITSFHL